MSYSIETEHLSLKYKDRLICDNLNMQIAPGTLVGVIARNGTGKTTLLNALAGLHKSEGTIKIQGHHQALLSRMKMAQTVGILFQKTAVHFPQTVYAYCSSGYFPHQSWFTCHLDPPEDLITQSLAEMELDHLSKRCVTTLSGGELQRLNIATLLVQQPQIYLLDEPMNHLDLYYQMKTLSLFQQMANTSISVVMTLHDLHYAAKFCQKILILFKDGTYLFGDAKNVLTIENIAHLYQLKNNTIHGINDKIAEYLEVCFN